MKFLIILIFFIEEVLSQGSCGTIQHTAESISAGNSSVKNGDFPWIVSYGFMNNNNSWTHKCGGTIISDKQVLTAFHCFRDLDLVEGKRFQIFAGDVDLNIDYDEDNKVQIREVVCASVHPDRDQNSEALYYDVAVLHLASPLNFTKRVQPICLPSSPGMKYTQRLARILGWGPGKGSLEQAKIEVLDNTYCNITYSSSIKHDLTAASKAKHAVPNLFNSLVLCAGAPEFGIDDAGACQGDSGGPLLVFETLPKGHFVQIGIVSGSISCKNFPGVYTSLGEPSIWSFVHEVIKAKDTIDSNRHERHVCPLPQTGLATMPTPTITVPTPILRQKTTPKRAPITQPPTIINTTTTTTTATTVTNIIISTNKQGSCDCPEAYVFAAKVVADKQGAVLGKYVKSELHNGRPYYVKTAEKNTKYYLQYQLNDWIISNNLGSNAFNIVLRQTGSECPLGIKGGFDRNQTYDETFRIECLADQSTQNCCKRLSVQASGRIHSTQGARLGEYNYFGEYNNHPVYHLSQYNYTSYLYYRMEGLPKDGWTISESPGDTSYSITTRQRTSCADEITSGFNLDKEKDTTFKISCLD